MDLIFFCLFLDCLNRKGEKEMFNKQNVFSRIFSSVMTHENKEIIMKGFVTIFNTYMSQKMNKNSQRQKVQYPVIKYVEAEN